MIRTREEWTAILRKSVGGDTGAGEELSDLLYRELKDVANACFRRPGPNPTTQITSLVHDAFVRLVMASEVDYHGRTHFRATAATCLRRILIDRARKATAAKRGGGAERVELHEGIALTDEGERELLGLGIALDRLERIAPRQARVVELHFLGGLPWKEVAEVTERSVRAVEKDWKFARAWLYRELEEKGGGD